MAAASILSIASGAADSSDVTVTSNTAIALAGHDSDSFVEIQLKDASNAYRKVGVLNEQQASGVLTGPGVYRFHRPASSSACGVFSG